MTQDPKKRKIRRDPPANGFAQWIYKKFFPKLENGFFVECGANDGIANAVCHWMEKEKCWTGINIEPNPYCFKDLVKNRPDCINVQIALSDTKGEAQFYYPTVGPRGMMPAQASLEESMIGRWPKDKYDQYSVQLDTYSNIIPPLTGHIDLFILDVEEHELSVLRGIGDCGVLPTVFCVETDKVHKNEVAEILEPMGYRFIANHKGNSFFRLLEVEPG